MIFSCFVQGHRIGQKARSLPVIDPSQPFKKCLCIFNPHPRRIHERYQASSFLIVGIGGGESV